MTAWQLYNNNSQCAFSSNLFHGQIVHISILQLSDPENKKCSPWKVFGINHPQTLRLLSRRGPRSPDARLSQHYMGPKMTFCHFLNFCRKKFSGLTIKLLHIFIQLWGLWFAKIMWQDLYIHSISAGNFFCQAWKLLSAEIWKMSECHFRADVMLRQSRVRASRASPAQKSQGLRVVYSKNFSRATFFVFWAT